MAISKKFAPPNSLVLISDPEGGDIPGTMSGALVASTDSCIAVGCRSEADGETTFMVGEANEVNFEGQQVFEGNLSTPSHRISIRSVLGETLLEASVPRKRTFVRVWVNDLIEPDCVFVAIN